MLGFIAALLLALAIVMLFFDPLLAVLIALIASGIVNYELDIQEKK